MQAKNCSIQEATLHAYVLHTARKETA